MQIYPLHFIYAAICLILIPVSFFAGAFVDYCLGIWWLSIIIRAIPAIFFCAAVSFLITAVNVEVWDYPYYRRL